MSGGDRKGRDAGRNAAVARGSPAREARLKAALKANMGRRKAQARARADVPEPGEPASGEQDRKDGP